ncbi:VTT domain-containing protein [bacterium]|nr:VTT domain-containing protein [candidate division CSSED10-310 bacterium]
MEEARFFLDHYGLWAIGIGAFFQGYLMVLLGGIMASQHLLPIGDVLLVAAIGAWAGHWFLYAVGHRLSHKRSETPGDGWHKPIFALERTIRNYPWASVFLMQYSYGIRLVSGIAFGFFRVEKPWFAWAQVLNCCLWSFVLSFTGYFVGTGFMAGTSGAQLSTILALFTLVTMLVLIRRHWRNELMNRETLIETIPVFIEEENAP